MSTATLACRSGWAGRGIAMTSQISPLVRSPADRAIRLPVPRALEKELPIIAGIGTGG